MSETTLDWLLNPIGYADFKANYFEQKHLIIKRSDPNYYDRILTFKDLSDCISNQVLTFPDCRLIDGTKDGTIPAKEYTLKDTILIDPIKLTRGYENGATLSVAGLQKRLPSLMEFNQNLMNEVHHNFQSNVYLTPAQSKGFTPHWDTHDVFVMQIYGSKDWKIYGNDVPLALKSEEFEKEGYQPGPVTAEFTLEAGDLLYIPRGLVHDAETDQNSSLHITLGMLGTTWINHIFNSLTQLADKDLQVRKYLPMKFGTNEESRKEYTQSIEEVLAKLRTLLLSEEPRHNEWEANLSNFLKYAPGQLESIERLKDLRLEDRVERRKNVPFYIQQVGDEIIIQVYDSELNIPAEAAELIDFIKAQNEPFKVADLPDILDDDSKVFITAKLVSYGILGLAQ